MKETPLRLESIETGKWRGRAPCAPLAIGMIGGIALDNAIEPSKLMLLIAAGVLLSTAAWYVLRRTGNPRAIVAALLIAAAAGMVRHAVKMRFLPSDHVARWTSDEPAIVTVTGRIATAPKILEIPRDRVIAYATPPRTRFIIDASAFNGIDEDIVVRGRIYVTVKEPMLFARLGDEVRITGRLARPRPSSNPGEYDWALYMRREGLHATLSTDHAAAVVTLSRRDSSNRVSSWFAAARDRARAYLLNDTVADDDASGGVLTAMVLGQRSEVDETINEAFVRTGTAHFLATSGMHVGWLALAGWWIARLFSLPYRRAAFVVALLILVYVLIAEPRPSILRAGIMGILACLAIMRQGGGNAVNWMSAAAFIILTLDPTDVFRPAFQFSFAAVLAIIYLTPRFVAAGSRWFGPFRALDDRAGIKESADAVPLTPRLPSRRRILADALLRGFRLAIAASLAAWIGNVPLTCYHFNGFPLLGAPYTLILWIPAFLVTAGGFVKLLLAIVFPSSTLVTGPILEFFNAIFLWTVQQLAAIPVGQIDGRSPSLLWVAAIYGAMILHLRGSRLFATRRRAIFVYSTIFLWWLVPPRWGRQDRGALNVWALAVGDGTATVIELPDGRTMLFDFGTRSAFDASTVGTAFFVDRGIAKIDTAFVSHANFDHYGAIDTIAAQTLIHRLVLNDQFDRFVEPRDGASRFLSNMQRAGTTIKRISGEAEWTDESGVRFELLWPPPVAERPAPTANDGSIALRLTFANRSILITGDQTEWGLGGMIARGDLSADVLILPHHGSVVHNTRSFIDAVNPRVAIRSSGQSRTMTTNGIEALVGETRSYLNTADDGAVRVRIDDDGLDVTTMRP